MYDLFNSETKSKVVLFLSRNPSSNAKLISDKTQINYKNTYKILSELLDKNVVVKIDNQYSIAISFIEYVNNLSKTMLKSYTNSVTIRNQLDLYNTLVTLYPQDDISEEVDKLIDSWLMKRLDDWYSKFYDFEDKEYKKVKDLILNNFDKNIELDILEVGFGTGRLTHKLAKDFSNVTAIDSEEKYVKYCREKFKLNNVDFKYFDIKDYESDKKYDVILFSWIGFHYQENVDEIIDRLKNLVKKKSMIIILDVYSETEYVDILQMIRPANLDEIKILRESLDAKLIKSFGNLNKEVLLTEYKFDKIEDVINNFKIELVLEESHIWTESDENLLKEYLLKKKEPCVIGEGLWVSVIKIN